MNWQGYGNSYILLKYCPNIFMEQLRKPLKMLCI